MKHLRETFTDQEFAELKAAKDASGKNWHDYLLFITRIVVAAAEATEVKTG